MADKRTVDELSIEELERILAIKKRQSRQQRLDRMKKSGRVIDTQATASHPTPPPIPTQAPANSSNGLPAQAIQLPAEAVQKRKAIPQFDDASVDYVNKQKNEGQAWRKFMDRSLVLVEILAVVGLIFLGVELFRGIGLLQDETAEAQRAAEEFNRASIPTLVPTPQLSLVDVVLPSGHTPPTENGGGQFNFEEIPPHLRGLVADQVYLPPDIQRAPVTDETAVVLRIPKINVDQTIVQGVDWEALKQGIGQVQNGIDPTASSGNVVLAAHNDIYGEVFRHLDQLEPGDQFEIHTRSRVMTYTITGWDVVEPTATHVMENRGGATATLISCYPYQVNSHRIVIFADRVDS